MRGVEWQERQKRWDDGLRWLQVPAAARAFAHLLFEGRAAPDREPLLLRRRTARIGAPQILGEMKHRGGFVKARLQ
jgi:hypothetical protein